MRLFHIALKSFWYYLRTNSAIGLGIATATAVLVGALLVGDSMRGSLRQITLDRLGEIDDVLTSTQFFRQSLVETWMRDPGVAAIYSRATPALLLPDATVELTSGDSLHRATQVALYGLPPAAWEFQRDPPAPPERGQIVLNQQLAEQLGLGLNRTYDAPPRVTLRIGIQPALSSDSALGKTEDLVEGVTDIEVTDVIPNRDLGRFDMRVSQLPPNSAFVSLDWLQSLVAPELWKGKSDDRQVNLVLLKRREPAANLDAGRLEHLQSAIRPSLEDLGLGLTAVRIGANSPDGVNSPAPVAEYLSLSTESLVFSDEIAETLANVLPPGSTPVFTYLANRIEQAKTAQSLPSPPTSPISLPSPPLRGRGQGGGAQRVNDPGEYVQVDVAAQSQEVNTTGIPFSMIAGIDWPPEQRPRSALGDRPIQLPGDGEIVLNSWAAQDLGVGVGDSIALTYFEPEATHGTQVERQTTLRLLDVAALTRPSQPFQYRRGALTPAEFQDPPTLANDPDLTPRVPGLTDAATIENWDLPFETPGIRPSDDAYWEEYRTTPKGFVSLETAQQLWGSRFGQVTSFRIPRPVEELDATRAELEARLAPAASVFGLQIQPLRETGLRAASGSTPFDLLFLGLSLFVIGSALILIGLLFRLALEQRASEVGLLAAVGFDRRRITTLWIGEMLIVCLCGGLLGLALGVAYAALLVWGLRTWWVGAIQVPFVQLHVTWQSLIIGAVVGGLIGLGTIAWSLFRNRGRSIVPMLRGRLDDESGPAAQRRTWSRWIVAGSAIASVAMLAAAPFQAGDLQAGLFVGGGFFVLLAGLLAARAWLRSPFAGSSGQLSVERLGLLNARRHPLRSVLTMGLVASAVFLIVSISAFRVQPGDFGTAGFDYVATSSQPIFGDLNSQSGREKLLREPEKFPSGATVLSFRFRSGDDASCNNPFQTSRPRVIGVPTAVVRYFDDPQTTPFRWAGFDRAAAREANKQLPSPLPRFGGEGRVRGPQRVQKAPNPWRVLGGESDADSCAAANSPAPGPDVSIPAVLDKNTAYYSLKVFQLGSEFEVDYDQGPPVRFRLVGLLDNSVLQGSVLIAERDFVRLFPNESGYRYFLLRAPAGEASQMLGQLESDLGDQGFDGVSAPQLLGQLMAVQNTYLSAFQSLGALGLLLGTFGLAAVVLRSIWERRRELGLLRAVGFSDRRLIGLLLAENLGLLLAGVAIGAVAALVAVVPHALLGAATLPLIPLLTVLLLVSAVGWFTIHWSARSILRTPILAALRSE